MAIVTVYNRDGTEYGTLDTKKYIFNNNLIGFEPVKLDTKIYPYVKINGQYYVNDGGEFFSKGRTDNSSGLTPLESTYFFKNDSILSYFYGLSTADGEIKDDTMILRDASNLKSKHTSLGKYGIQNKRITLLTGYGEEALVTKWPYSFTSQQNFGLAAGTNIDKWASDGMRREVVYETFTTEGNDPSEPVSFSILDGWLTIGDKKYFIGSGENAGKVCVYARDAEGAYMNLGSYYIDPEWNDQEVFDWANWMGDRPNYISVNPGDDICQTYSDINDGMRLSGYTMPYISTTANLGGWGKDTCYLNLEIDVLNDDTMYDFGVHFPGNTSNPNIPYTAIPYLDFHCSAKNKDMSRYVIIKDGTYLFDSGTSFATKYSDCCSTSGWGGGYYYTEKEVTETVGILMTNYNKFPDMNENSQYKWWFAATQTIEDSGVTFYASCSYHNGHYWRPWNKVAYWTNLSPRIRGLLHISYYFPRFLDKNKALPVIQNGPDRGVYSNNSVDHYGDVLIRHLEMSQPFNLNPGYLNLRGWDLTRQNGSIGTGFNDLVRMPWNRRKEDFNASQYRGNYFNEVGSGEGGYWWVKQTATIGFIRETEAYHRFAYCITIEWDCDPNNYKDED